MNEQHYFPCPLCESIRPIEMTKNRKPYLKCNDCGVQLFIRGASGIRRLAIIAGQSSANSDGHSLIKRIDLFRALTRRLKELESEKPIWGVDEEIAFQVRAIEKQLRNLRADMEEAAPEPGRE